MGNALITRRGGVYATIKFENYNSPLQKGDALPALSQARSDLAATSVGNYALFGGGFPPSSVVDAYNISLTRSTPTELSQAGDSLAAISVGNYALFGGGYADSSYFATVDAYASMAKFTIYKDSKYKFQNMEEEITISSAFETISIPTPATGYIKVKNITIS